MLFQGAAQVVAAVNHHPAAVVLDPLQRRRHALVLGRAALAVRALAPAADHADRRPVQLGTEQLIGERDRLQLQLLVGPHLFHRLAEGLVERLRAAAGVGEQRGTAFQTIAQAFQRRLAGCKGAPAVQVEEQHVADVPDRRRGLALQADAVGELDLGGVEQHVDAGLAHFLHEEVHGPWSRVPVAVMGQLADLEVAAFRLLRFRIVDDGNLGQTRPGRLQARGIGDHVGSQLEGELAAVGLAQVFFPVARQWPRTVHHHPFAALLDAPQAVHLTPAVKALDLLLGEHELARGVPHRMIHRHLVQLAVGEQLLHQGAEIVVELGIATTGLREQETAVLHVFRAGSLFPCR